MSYKVLVSNSTGEDFDLPLRIMHKDESYIQHFIIPAYALNNELIFNNEELYNRWLKEHACYFKDKIKVGKATGHSLEKMNADHNIETEKRIASDQRSIDNIDEVAGVETQVEATNSKKSRK